MRRRSATTGLMADASQALQETVGVLSNPEKGAAIVASGHISRWVALWRTRVARSRSEFFRFSSRYLSDISAAMMLGRMSCFHTRLVPDPYGFSQFKA